MSSGTISIYSHHGSKSAVERAAQAVFTACGFFAVLAVASIALYMVVSGTPALFKVGIREILFGNLWRLSLIHIYTTFSDANATIPKVFIFYREKMLDLTGMQSAEQLNSILDVEIEGMDDGEELIAVAYK